MTKARTAMLLAGLMLAACDGSGDEGGAAATDDAPAAAVQFTRDAAVGELYAAPGPRSCTTKTAPASGAISAAQAAAYAICGREGEFGPFLTLLDKVVVTDVAKARPYNPVEYVELPNVDVTKPIHQIRGNLVSYHCSRIMPAHSQYRLRDKPGTNCTEFQEPKAEGICYKDTFGDWRCSLVDLNATKTARENVAPPAA